MTIDDAADAVPAARIEPVPVDADEAEMRLDRWFRRRFPQVSHGELEKWLRTGQVRIDGRRAKAGDRLSPGQQVRIPPAARTAAEAGAEPRHPATQSGAADLVGRVLYQDALVLAIDKPAGLAVQGGSKTTLHVDGMLDALRFGGERPRLVHRLDKDTAGVLVLARTAAAAASLTAAFASRAVRKLYWAAVVGVPPQSSGRIAAPLAKRFGTAGERVGSDAAGLPATTDYRVIERAGHRAAWLALEPRTGRTHQLRAHCVLLGTPILGDGKYGGAAAFLEGQGLGQRLHLLARSIRLPHPAGGEISVTAPLPPHMRATWRFFGFPQDAGEGAPDLLTDPPRPRRRSTARGTAERRPARHGRRG